MMPDRYLESKSRKPVKNPYSAAKKPVAAVARPNPGQVQPELDVQPSMAAEDPMAGPPGMGALLKAPPALARGPGAEDLMVQKYNQDFAHGKTQNTYQSPLEYETHLNTVQNTPMMKELANGLELEKQLRADFLRNAPAQEDLTPIMGLADYLAKGKGTARSSYKRPGSYDDLVGQIHGMLDSEQKARYNNAQLAFEQAGGLKSGTEEVQGKQGVDAARTQGYKIPPPRMGNPSTMVDAFYRGFQNTPVVKDATGAIQAAKAVRANIGKKNWLGDEAAKAEILKAMKLFPVSDRDAARVTGSPDIMNRIDRVIDSLQNGRALTSIDAHTIEQFAQYHEQRGFNALNNARDEYIKGMGPSHGVDYSTGQKILGAQIPEPTAVPQPQAAQESEFKKLFMESFKK